MGKAILYCAVTADGFIARENGSVDFLPLPPKDSGFDRFFESVDTLIMGRKTYEQTLGFGIWPFAGKRCFVASSKKGSDDRVEFTKDAVRTVKELKENHNIWIVGGAILNSALIKEKLIDEVKLTVVPVILGRGIHLFDKQEEFSLEFLSAVIEPLGMVEISYKVKYNH